MLITFNTTQSVLESTPVGHDGLRGRLRMLGRAAGQHCGLRLDRVHAGPQHTAAVRAFHGVCHAVAGLHVHEQREVPVCMQTWHGWFSSFTGCYLAFKQFRLGPAISNNSGTPRGWQMREHLMDASQNLLVSWRSVDSSCRCRMK